MKLYSLISYLTGGGFFVLKSFSAASSPQCSLQHKEIKHMSKIQKIMQIRDTDHQPDNSRQGLEDKKTQKT